MKAKFAGANIKGTPSMSERSVSHDLRVLRDHADVFGVQEFEWPWYWHAAIAVLPNWATYPSKARNLRHPTMGAQSIFWKKRSFRKLKSYGIPAFDFDRDHGGIMQNRWVRAVLLESKTDGFTAWFLSTHFVVGGDRAGSGVRRKNFMRQNINDLDEALRYLTKTGYPIMGELDANIHPGTWAYALFMQMMMRHHAKFHGHLGIEYAFTIDGTKGRFTKVTPSTIPTSKLKTDHEVRLLEWVGVAKH